MKTLVVHNGSRPWVCLVDARDWKLSPQDAWRAANELTSWMYQNHCALMAIVLSNKMQQFSFDKELSHSDILFSFDYDEAHQSCLNALAGSKNQQDK